MSVYISFEFSPAMEPKEWNAVWLETLEMLQQFPIPLVRGRYVESEFGKRSILSQRLAAVDENGVEAWSIWGDRISRGLAETFTLYRPLDHYRKDDNWAEVDPLYCEMFENLEGDRFSGQTLYHCETNGEPYHYAVLAVGILLESRFPNYVFVHGDMTLESAQMVKQWLNKVCNEAVNLPVCIDAARLWNRLEGVLSDSETLIKRFLQTYAGSKARAAQWLLTHSENVALNIYARRLATYDSANQFGAIDIIRALLEGSQSLDLTLAMIRRANDAHAAEKKKLNAKPFALSDVLDVFCRYFITLPMWDGVELDALTKYMESDGNSFEMLNRTFMRMAGAPSRFSFFMDPDDLLEAFVAVEPGSRDRFAVIISENDEKNKERLRQLSDKVDATMAKLEDKANGDLPTREDFPAWIMHFAESNAKGIDDLEENMRSTGLQVKKQSVIVESYGTFGDNSTAALLKALTDVDNYDSLYLFEESWDAIDQISSSELLRRMITLLYCTTTVVSVRRWTRLIMQNSEYWSMFEQA